MFEWGEQKLKESLETGYIQYTMGFRLKLPFFDRFEELKKNMDGKSKEFWENYRAGKDEHKALEASIEAREEDPSLPLYVIEDQVNYKFYKKHAPEISKYFSLRSGYLRLCLNAPSQGMAAHMTKKAMVMLFDYIKSKGHLGIARICNMVHD